MKFLVQWWFLGLGGCDDVQQRVTELHECHSYKALKIQLKL